MRTDAEIEDDVKAELLWSPEVDETDIAVKVKDRVVALTGFVHTLAEKYRAESAATRIAGVAGVANDLQVRVAEGDARPDPEIAREAVSAIRSAIPIQGENIQVLVDQGTVTLEGKVEWQFQRESAERAVSSLRGVRTIENFIQIIPRVSPKDIQRKINAAFHRNATIDARSITIDTQGGEVTLRGKVHSWSEKEAARATAWAAPGVTRVTNEIVVIP